MTRRVIRVFWGPRPESVQAVAIRWRRTLEHIEFLLPEAVDWSWQQIRPSGTTTAVTVDQLARALDNARAAEDLGVGLTLACGGGRTGTRTTRVDRRRT